MTQLLEKAFAEVSQLPEKEQDTIAQRLLAESASKKHWSDLFESSQDELARLADEALAEHKARKAVRL
jgi:1,2-phenylacetyl-CoA epoxidase catalytic subunit